MLLRLFHGSSHGCEINCFENITVQCTGFVTFKGHTKHDERISQSLNTDADRAVTHVTATGGFNRIVVDVDDFIQVARDDFGDIIQTLKIKLSVIDKARQCDGGKITNGDFIRSRVLYDFCAEVRALNGAKIFLVTLFVAGVFI